LRFRERFGKQSDRPCIKVDERMVPTPSYDRLGLSKEQLQGFVILLGRVGTPDEIAKAVVFLASDDSSFVNGIELFVDSGMAQI
jgi:NAD(P)-dependent dehydrogenase (short-subunit alcohol dehydrogenase family)